LLRILNRDLVMAGLARKVKDPETGKVRIDKRDGRGWSIDVHGLRTTFGTHLSKGGVPLRTAQAAMRHSDPRLTANVYTDPHLLDVAGAMEVLPSLPLDGDEEAQQQATGTCDDRALAPVLAPNLVQASTSQANADKIANRGDRRGRHKGIAVSAGNDRSKKPLSFPDNGSHKSGRLDLNQRPPAPKAGALPS